MVRPMYGILQEYLSSGAILWQIIPFSIVWLVWKERNDRISWGGLADIDNHFRSVLLGVAKWASLRREFIS